MAFDESDAAGFTLEYGIPRLNCKNPYRSFLYAAPDLKNEYALCAKRQWYILYLSAYPKNN